MAIDWFGVQPVTIVLQQEDGSPRTLDNLDGLIKVHPSPAPSIESIDSGSRNVSTLVPLKAFTNLSAYSALYFYLVNRDDVLGNSNDVFMLVECSDDGEREDVNNWELQVGAGKQGNVLIPAGFFTPYWRISAYTTSPGFPTVPVQWGIKGVLR